MIASRLLLICGLGMGIASLSALVTGCETPQRTPYEQYVADKQRSDAAAQRLRALDGRIEMRDPGATVILRDLPDREAREAFALLHDLLLLDGLRVERVELTRRNTRELENLHMRHLTVSRTRLTGDALDNVFNIAGLRAVHLIDTGAGDAAVDHLLNHPDLETLTLSYEPLTDAGLATLAQLRRLRTLRLVSTDVSDEALEALVEANTRLVIELGDDQVIRGVDATR